MVTAETQIATGYYRLGIWDDEPADRLLAKYDVLDGIVSTTGQVMLGMTVGCARCHDHKKDPIPQRDYYRLLAFFRDVTDMNAKNTRNIMSEDDRRERERLAGERLKSEGELYQQMFAIEQRMAKALDEKQGTRFSRQPVSDLVDLKFRFYRDTWQSLPDFDSLKVETEGELPRNFVTLAAASRREAMGLVFEGSLKVPQAGEYAFACEATEGVRLIVSGRAVIDQPAGGAHQKTARLQLPAGLVPIRVEYFNSDKKPQLKIDWEGPGVARRWLTDEAQAADNQQFVADSRSAPQEWAYSFEQPAKEWAAAVFDDSAWKRGPGGFGTAGTPGTVIRTVWDTKDIWLRKKFRVGEIPERIAIDLHHDDEVELYLNGRIVFESRGYLVAYKRVVLPVEAVQALTPGDNLIAVHCHQTTGGQSIDVGLLAAPERDVLQALVARQGDELLGPGTAAKHKVLGLQLEALRKQTPPEPGLEIMCVAEQGREKTHVLIRGNPGVQGDVVEPGFPLVLTSAVPEIHERS